MSIQIDLDSEQFLFSDRIDASNKLLDILLRNLVIDEDLIILALSKGSVKIVNNISGNLGIDFDLLISKDIHAPNNSDCVIAVMSELNESVIHTKLVDSFGISFDDIKQIQEKFYSDKIAKLKSSYRDGLNITNIKDKRVLLIDEGCETGLRALCGLKSVLSQGASEVMLALPLIPFDVHKYFLKKFDKVYVSKVVNDFIRVNYYYKNLQDIKRKEVRKILESSKYYKPFKGDKKDEL